MAEQIINIERMEQVVGPFGNLDENVRMIESEPVSYTHLTLPTRWSV